MLAQIGAFLLSALLPDYMGSLHDSLKSGGHLQTIAPTQSNVVRADQRTLDDIFRLMKEVPARFLQFHAFAERFSWSRVEGLVNIVIHRREPQHEFIDTDLEVLRHSFIDRASFLLSMLQITMHPIPETPEFCSVMPYERERFPQIYLDTLKEGVHAFRGIGGYALSSHAIITGGSSGIGLATACLLASKGMSITIVARNIERLNWGKDQIESAARGRVRVWAISCDVGAREACRAAVAESISELGSPNWAISNAGIVTPGTFMAQSLDDHEAQLQTNYIGSLNFVHSVIPNMATHGGGHLVFVGSGAALVGLFGYSGYGPSKFAIRGLAEVLRIELRPHRIIVTLVHPPDTNTPQLAFEAKMRPGPTSEIARAAGVWEPEQIAKALFKGASKGRFLVTPGLQLTMLSVLSGIVGPAFRSYQDWVVSKYPK